MQASPITARAESTPDERALATPATELSWRELAELVDAATRALAALPLGTPRVAIMASNSVETVLAYLAAMHAGLSVVPVSFHLTAREVRYILRDSGASAVLCDENSLPVVDDAAVGIGGNGVGVFAWGESWQQLLEMGRTAPEVDLATVPRPNLLYTSGTTGFPKGVERPPTMPPTVGQYLLEQVEPDDAGTYLAVGPLYHTGPMRAIRRLAGGRPLYVLPSFDAEAVLATIEAEHVTGTLMVPTHFVRLLALPADVRARYDVSSMRALDHTGAACPIPVKQAMIDWFGPVLVEKYGGTESGSVTAINSTDWLAHPGSVGRTVAPFEAVVVDDADQPVPVGVEGRLYFRDTTGKGITFYGDPDKTAAAHIAPNVFTVGDLGKVDEDGFVYITGRHSDMVVSGGVNLYPAESEQVLLRHPAVHDAAVIGVPHESMGEQLKALVVLHDGATAGQDELIAFCRENLAHIKCPRSIEFVADLGRSPMGKINKKALKAPYWESAATTAGR